MRVTLYLKERLHVFFVLTHCIYVYQQVTRIKSHASLLLWSGNNENEKALRQSW